MEGKGGEGTEKATSQWKKLYNILVTLKAITEEASAPMVKFLNSIGETNDQFNAVVDTALQVADAYSEIASATKAMADAQSEQIYNDAMETASMVKNSTVRKRLEDKARKDHKKDKESKEKNIKR